MPLQRTTRQSKAVQSAIEASCRPLTIDEIHSAASEDAPTIGIRTVYRVVRRLQETGVIVSIPVAGGTDRYELASIASKHHHHFHCTRCDRYFDVAGCPGGFSDLLPEGFKLQSHELTLSGLCQSCV